MSAAESISIIIRDVVKDYVSGKDVAVAFSGGLDSGLIGGLSMEYARSVRFYVAGVPGCHDILAAEQAAAEMGGDLEVIAVDDAVSVIRDEIEATGCSNPLMLAFSSPLFCVLRRCSEEYVIGGTGADEVFGGYNKYVSVPDSELKERMKEDSDRFWAETYPHEERMASKFGKTLLRPYFDDRVVSFMDALPPEEIRPSQDDRKKVLCGAASLLGFDHLSGRPKKAAQYGSGILDAVKAVCRERGMEYNQLVAELCR